MMTTDGKRWMLFDEVERELRRQTRKFGEQNHRDAHPALLDRDGGASPQRLAEDLEIPTASRAKFICNAAARAGHPYWSAILVEEVAEAVAEIGDDAKLRAELVQVAAVAVAWIEAIDRRGGR